MILVHAYTYHETYMTKQLELLKGVYTAIIICSCACTLNRHVMVEIAYYVGVNTSHTVHLFWTDWQSIKIGQGEMFKEN